MFNHLVYNQTPHHSISHSTAREMYQGWLDPQQVVNESEFAITDDITKKSDLNIDDGMYTHCFELSIAVKMIICSNNL